ncbi:MAG: hypothetical protein ACI81V_000379 [Lentimonas sp.]|jgi:hypothetical protein
MDLYHSTDMDGISELNPDRQLMRRILSSLDSPDAAHADHPDVSLVHDGSGWSLSVFPSGVVTFENLDHDDAEPLYISEVSRNQSLALWEKLSLGDIESLRLLPWQQ